MRGIRFGAAAALAATLCAAPATAAERASALSRTGAWQLDYAENVCTLMAMFGSGDDRVIARLTWLQPGEVFDLALIGPRFTSGSLTSDAVVQIGPDAEPMAIQAIHGKLGSLPFVRLGTMQVAAWQTPGGGSAVPASPAAATSRNQLILRQGKRSVSLDLGSMTKALAGVRACTDDLVRSWGFDPAVQAALVKAARPTDAPSHWLTSEDYPTDALWSGASSLLKLRIDVDARGAVKGCHILAKTKGEQFPEPSCTAIKRRARFEPAEDAQGRTVDSFYIMSLFFRAR